MNKNVLSVSQINQYIKNLIDEDFLLSDVYISGEISNFKAHHTGFYFTLKDAKAAINCVMFKAEAEFIKFMPENGMKVIIYGRVSVYEKNGNYQIYAETIEPLGKGAILLAYEQLKERLSREGLFDSEHKRPVSHVKNLGVITSGTGAVVSDIITVSGRLNPFVKIYFFPASVQGDTAPEEIIEALKLANNYSKAKLDAIILGRGGGSNEDLSPFNNEMVARAVFNSKIPVISAVGHETDFTICDFVADLRAETPSAAAEMAVSDISIEYEKIEKAFYFLSRMMYLRIDEEEVNIKEFVHLLLESRTLTDPKEKQLIRIHGWLSEIMEKIIFEREKDAYGKMEILEKISPVTVMKRGFSFVTQNGKVLKSAKDIDEKAFIKISFIDGEITAWPEMRK